MKARIIGYIPGIGNPSPAPDDATGMAVVAVSTAATAAGFPIPPEVIQQILNFFHIGPSYNPANGGEVRRQLEGDIAQGLAYVNPYLNYVQTYNPSLWQSGDIWDAPPPFHRSFWKDRYEQLLSYGMPPGTLLDQNMVPVGLGDALNRLAEAEEAAEQAPPTPPDTTNTQPRPQPRPTTTSQARDQGWESPKATNNTMLLLGGAALLFLLNKR